MATHRDDLVWRVGVDAPARRLVVSTPLLYLLTAAWVASVPNAVTLGRFVGSSSAGHGLGALSFVAGGWFFVLTITYAAMYVIAPAARGNMARVTCSTMLVAAAALSYFTTFLGTQIDKSMVLNIVDTNANEALELVNARLVAWVAAVGVLPAIAAWRLPLAGQSRLRIATRGAAALVALVVLTLGLVYSQYSRYASAARNRDISIATVAPTNLLVGGVAYGASAWAANTVRAPRGVDAHAAYAIQRPRLLVLVLGETARAANHGLNGYARDTTPRMKAAGGYYFPDTETCGTATSISVPCIFSGLSRQDFSLVKGRQNETLIDVVKRSGARVIWLDNDSGCKDVCSAADYQDITGSRDPRFCPEPAECHDAILLDGLEQRILAEERDTLIVLHLKGSHGPAYHKRYPREFERFTPVCRTSDLGACGTEELVNAYDNSILYTDHIVGESIEVLKRIASRYATALLYVSDHGESLGEAGLYLHGMPWAVAPREQKTVPMYSWVSPEFIHLEGWNSQCMARQTLTRRSHDNIYPTVLGFMEVESVEYKPELDLFEPCDPPKHQP